MTAVAGFVFISLDQHERSNWSDKVVEFSRIMPTVWPIIFAAVFGDAIKWFAYWRLERGVQLQPLDRLIASQTLGSTLLTIITYRSITIWTTLLLAMWSLSPLGSQAFLRVLTLDERPATKIGTVSYVNPGLDDYLDPVGPFCCGSGTEERFRTILGVYTSVLFRLDIGTQYNKLSEQYDRTVALLGGQTRAGRELAMDAWGNVRIPALHRLEGYNANNEFEWLQVGEDSGVLDYASLIGTAYRGIPVDFIGNTTFLVNQSYHLLSCSPWVVEYPEGPKSRSPWLGEHYPATKLGLYNTSLKDSEEIMKIGLRGKGSTWFFTDFPEAFSNATEILKGSTLGSQNRHILLGSRGWSNGTNGSWVLSFTSCAVKMQYIQASITCHSFGLANKRICGVDRMRKNPEPPRPESVTAFEWSNLATQFAASWPGALKLTTNHKPRL